MAEPSTRIVPDTISAGLKTEEMVGAAPYCFRVTWINWDSGFRGTDLRIGDRIVGVNGERFDLAKRQAGHYPGAAIGTHREIAYWSKLGTLDDAGVTLTVYRRGRYQRPAEYVEIRGKLRSERYYYDAEGRQLLGPGGPDLRSSDGFGVTWISWYEDLIKFSSRVLDGSWQGRGFESREQLGAHLAGRERLDFLTQNHAGAFAAQVLADWEVVQRSLLGTRYEISERDLAYRQLGEHRQDEIAATALAAREAFLQAHAAETIDPFPALDPAGDGVSNDAGKIVALPPILPYGQARDSQETHLVSGDQDQGFYFIDIASPALGRMAATVERYKRLVRPKIAETYGVIGRITAHRRTLEGVEGGATGRLLDALAVTVGDQLFVDLSRQVAGVSPFAGEETFPEVRAIPPPDDATPAQVLDAFFSALKANDRALWSSLFAPWEADRSDDQPSYRPDSPPSHEQLLDLWEDARSLIMDEVYDVRVCDAYEAGPLFTSEEIEGAPVIEQALVEVDHVGLFEGEHRSFSRFRVHRLWALQRLPGGPWRVATRWGI